VIHNMYPRDPKFYRLMLGEIIQAPQKEK